MFFILSVLSLSSPAKYSKQFLNTPNMEVNPALFYYYGVSLLKTNNIPQALESHKLYYLHYIRQSMV